MKAADISIFAGFLMAALGASSLLGLTVLPFATTSTSVTVLNPVAISVTATPLSGQAPLSVALSATATGGSSPYAYSWTDGNGHTSTAASWTTSYAAAGTYTASVTVTDNLGGKATGTASVTTSAPVSLSCSVNPPVTYTGQNVVISCGISNGAIYYGWAANYGDGTNSGSTVVTTASGYSFTHAFSAAGTYTVTITGNSGMTSGGTCPNGCYSIVSTLSIGAGASSPPSALLGMNYNQVAGLGLFFGGILLMGYGYKEKERED